MQEKSIKGNKLAGNGSTRQEDAAGNSATRQENAAGNSATRHNVARGQRSVKQWIALGLVVIGIPGILLLSWQMGDRKYYLTSMLVLVCAIAAFWLSFERRRPQTREMVLIAVMCAIAVASRAAFIAFPQFKPIVGIVMICGMALGPQAGFMTGSISAFVSDFIFGQGAWTPWQMFAFGLAGLLAGYLCRAGVMTSGRRVLTAVIGGVMILLLIGPILDTCTLFTMSSMVNTTSAGAVYLAGVPFNAVHALAVALTLLVMARPMIEKLDRIKIKYGMMEAE